MTDRIRIGTRGSRLALHQTNMVAERLRAAHPGLAVEIVEITTSGDWRPEQGETRLSEAAGGKGLFAREIEHAILDGRIDCGVHSLKDMPSFLPDGLCIDITLPRAEESDALIAGPRAEARAGKKIGALADLPQGAVIGTSSTRRAAYLLRRRPDLKIVPFRGNVPTRLAKLKENQVDATILACAGLARLGLEDEIGFVLAHDDMLPAACQGIVAVETRAGDTAIRTLLTPIHCHETGLRAAAERAVLQALDGSCQTPIGAFSALANGIMTVTAGALSLDGASDHHDSASAAAASVGEAAALGTELGERLRRVIPPAWLAR